MEIRNTEKEELEQVMALYAAARDFMARSGNPNQWTNGYPQRALISGEIERGESFVCVEKGTIAAVFSLICGEEESYRTIRGAWLNDAPYATVHRICAAKQGGGAGAFCLQWCLDRCGNIRIDTHRDNLPMQRLLKKCGFAFCGEITLQDGSERLAFQKMQTAEER